MTASQAIRARDFCADYLIRGVTPKDQYAMRDFIEHLKKFPNHDAVQRAVLNIIDPDERMEFWNFIGHCKSVLAFGNEQAPTQKTS
jgi:hypothetical protein